MLRMPRPETQTGEESMQDRPPRPFSTPQQPQRSGSQTVIGQHVTLEGIIRADEDLLIEGVIKGTVELERHHLTIGANGRVEADIKAEHVTISGRLSGNVVAQGKVEITREADFEGDIKAKRIAIDDGAYVKASIELEREKEQKRPQARGPIEAVTSAQEERAKQAQSAGQQQSQQEKKPGG